MEKWSIACSEYASRQLRRYEEITKNFKNKFKHYYNKRQNLNIKLRDEASSIRQRSSENHLHDTSLQNPRKSSHHPPNNPRSSAKSTLTASKFNTQTPSKPNHYDSTYTTTSKNSTKKAHKISYNIHEKTCMSLPPTKSPKPPIPFHQSYLENEAEVEKRIKDLTKMLKEKIEQILLTEKRTKDLDDLTEKNNLGEATLKHDYDSYKLYQTEHKVLEQELMEMKGQIL
jgi:hypothetical protein